MTWDPVWEQIFSTQNWGKYPGEKSAAVLAATSGFSRARAFRSSGSMVPPRQYVMRASGWTMNVRAGRGAGNCMFVT
jgi:hypothetical protein